MKKSLMITLLFLFLLSLSQTYLYHISKINETILSNETLIKNYNSSLFYQHHHIYKILSFIKMGNPPQDVIAYIKPQSDSLLIGELEIPNDIYSTSFYKGYLYNASSSFINI